MAERLIESVEKFLADGGKPIMGATLTMADMRARYGDAFMDEFVKQANEFIRGEPRSLRRDGEEGGDDDSRDEFSAYWPDLADYPDGVDIFREQYGPPTGGE